MSEAKKGLKREDWEDAIAIQTASNLSGILRSLSSRMDEIWEDVRATNEGNNSFNRHPLVQLYVYKLFALAFAEPLSQDDAEDIMAMFHRAYTIAKAKATLEGKVE